MSLNKLFESFLVMTLHKGYVVSLWPRWRRFVVAAKNPQVEQLKILKRILSHNVQSVYGIKYNFAKIRSVEEFQKSVPIVDYDALEPWINRMLQGNGFDELLTSSTLRLFEISGGSSGTNKYIPYTPELLSEFSNATHAWLFDVYARRNKLLGTKAYWSISPLTRREHRTPGGLPIGMVDDTEYFGPLGRWALSKLMVAQASLAKITDLDKWRYSTLLHLLKSRNLGLISIWHPSFLTLLLESLETHRDSLLTELSPLRRQEVASAFDNKGHFSVEKAWPHLKMISCWTDASARDYIPTLSRALGGIEIQSKGLLATEGVISIPVSTVTKGCPLAVSAHFLEFLDLQDPTGTPRLAHELIVGKRYSPLLTTSGGLYRYHLKDEVECVGMWHKTPCIRFLGKLDGISDICGEKLTPAQVESAFSVLKAELGISWDFALLGRRVFPKPCYILYVEGNLNQNSLDQIKNKLETILCESHHYHYCRKLGQLGELQICHIHNGAVKWQNALVSQGYCAGSLKPLAIDTRLDWEKVF